MSWKKIGAASGYVMTGTIATQLLQWIIMSSIAHMEGPKTLGFFALAQALILPLQYLSWLSIRSRYLVLTSGREIIPDFLLLRAAVPAATFAVALAAIAAVAGDPELIYISAFAFVFKYIEGFYDLIYAVMQKEGQARLFARLAIIRTIISGCIFVSTYYATRNLYAAMFLTAAQQAGLLFFVKTYLQGEAGTARPSIRALDRSRQCYRLAIELLPLGVSLVVMSLNSSVSRLLLNGMVGAKELGYFAAVGSFISLGAIATASLGQSLLQPLAASISAGAARSFWHQLIWPMLFVTLSCIAGAIVSSFAGSALLGLIYGPQFKGISPLLIAGALASGPVFAASIASNGVFAAYMRNALFWSQVATLVFTTIGTIALVPWMGIMGVFVAMALSSCIQILICIYVLRRFWASTTPDRAHQLHTPV